MQEIVLVHDRFQDVILGWLAEHMSYTNRTANTYAAYLVGLRFHPKTQQWLPMQREGADPFADYLRTYGLSLFDSVAQIAPMLQAWAALPNSRKDQAVSKSTHNLRIAAVASFYEYAIRHGVYPGPNPAERVKRQKRKIYSGAKPLAYKDGEIFEQLDAIPTRLPNDLRDKAMLYLVFYTGRRLSEIADLKCGDVERQGSQWVFTWRHTKGDQPRKNELPTKGVEVVPLLSRWLKRHYGAEWPSDAYVFPSLSRHNYGGRMSAQGIEQRCAKWLGTSKFHQLRHTFAAVYLDSGGTVHDLSKLLGHSSLAVTTAYVGELGEGRNDKLKDMAAIYAGKKPKR